MTTLGIFTVKQFRVHNGIYYTYGGFGDYLDAIRPYFSKTIMIAHVSKGPPPKGYYPIAAKGLVIVHLPIFKTELGALITLPLMFLTAMRYIKRMDVVHARMPDYTGIMGAVASKLKNVPCFHQIVDDWYEQAKSMSPFRKMGLGFLIKAYFYVYDVLERLVSHRTLVFAQGKSCFDKHARHSDCELVLSSSHHEIDIISPRDRFSKKPFTILNVARLTYAKNQVQIIHALERLNKQSPVWRIVFVGEGGYKALLEKEAARLGVLRWITFTGQLPRGAELWEQFDGADVFVLSSHNEGTPKVILEAMARGLPVVASAVSGVPSSVTHEVRGLLYEPNNTQQLVDAVKRMAQDKALRRRCAANGHLFAKQHTVGMETAAMMKKVFTRWPHLEMSTLN